MAAVVEEVELTESFKLSIDPGDPDDVIEIILNGGPKMSNPLVNAVGTWK